MSFSRQFIAGVIVLMAINTATATTLTAEQQALHILNRLAYGPTPGDIQRIQVIGVDSYIEAQLHPEQYPLPLEIEKKISALPLASKPAPDLLATFYEVRKSAREDDEDKKKRREFMHQLAEQAAQVRLIRAIGSPRQLEEVMVDFWFNHFNVFGGKGLDRALVLSYEKEAIRPYVFGRFRELLGATARHPAMLFYLDNWLSSASTGPGPDSMPNAGKKKKSNGINENYARELMELHTLGVDGGYTQKDVTELAKIFTGWTFDPKVLARSGAGYRFDQRRHDWGEKYWLHHRVKATGQNEGELALDILAAHPATARHISYKLAQYFVADSPPASLVERLSEHFLKSQGDIRSLLRVLFKSPEFWEASGQKFKTPYRYVISTIRASDVNIANYRPLIGVLTQLGMPIYGCQTPDGYKNTESAWLNPDALTRRIEYATALGTGMLPLQQHLNAGFNRHAVHIASKRMAGKKGEGSAPDSSVLLDTLGSSVSLRTREAIANSQTKLQSALILGSPDFMRH